MALILSLLFAVVAALRVADTWRRFSQTYDEPFHIVMGLEWLERGTYRLEVQHPPLARIFDAIGPFLAGRRLPPGNILVENAHTVQEAGNDVLAQGDYHRNLILARAGALPFLLLGIFVVWAWTRRLAGDAAAAIAVLLFSTLPPILAHAGLATTDMAAAATTPAAILAFVIWMETPTWKTTALFTLAAAAALLSKFSSIPFCGLAMLLIALNSVVPGASPGGVRPKRLPPQKQIGAIVIGVALLVWATYRFTIWPQPIYNFPPPAILAALGDKHDVGSRALLHLLRLGPIPAPEFFTGIAHLSAHQAEGHQSYLFGQVSTTGWWYFFPVAIGVKTPIAFLLIAIPAAIWTLRQRSWQIAAPALAAIAVMVVAMLARIDIGIRHVLPIYAPLAVCGGIGAWRFWNAMPRRDARVLLAMLLAWQVAASALAHPDYLASFNELAGSRPDHILVDSNLDWGQDLPRLREAIRENGVRYLWISYFGSTNLRRYPLGAELRQLPQNQRVRGWIAVSRTLLAGTYEGRGYAWLKNETPVEEIGKSMLLYYVR
jgi:4-amino-4-deoxy-L-arabinose transferase-like glycosyltransferase